MVQGECTITLEDISIQLGLCSNGFPICGHTAFPWLELCQYLLGVAPPPKQLDGQRLSVTWIIETFNHLYSDADDEVIF